jgi:alkanesulfonate monooxygenase SsuD/methylene tetrahydromethanopterin reductase-like flavin-dependent oxidoreductase (luciferase family)
MQLGLFNLMTLRDNPAGVRGVIEDTRQMVRLAEEAGFDVAGFAEHHFTTYSVSVSPLMMAAHFAGLTQRIRLGAAVVVLPLSHPMRVAEEIGLLDQLSDGRAVLGVGTGYQRYEFVRYSTPVEEKTAVFLEYWSIVEQALVEGRAAFTGKYVSAPESVFTVRPVQKPMPPLFVTSVHPAILRRLAKYDAVPFMTAGYQGSRKLIELAASARESWRVAGLDQRPMPFALQQYIHVTDSADEALEAAERARYVARTVAMLRGDDVTLKRNFLVAPPLPEEPSLAIIRDNLLIGDPHHVAERMVDEIRQINPVHYNCFFQFGDMPVRRALRSLERFAGEVLPLVERSIGKLSAMPGVANAIALAD